ncbi:MAG: hypothetical protein Q9221_007801 [Calogaya cf. arnoldii]
MSRTVTISKFVGTISLGLLTGLSYAHSRTTIPPLLALPSATPAHSTFRQLRALTSRHQVLLSSLSASTLVMAFLLSPQRGRHPYLLWATLATAGGWASETYSKLVGKKAENGAARGNEKRSMREGSWTEDEEWIGDEEGNVNGEVVREGMEGWKVKQAIKAGIWGVGWVVAVVGLWGDGV